MKTKTNYFGTAPPADINAKYTNGNFTDRDTGNEITLKEGAHLQMTVYQSDITPRDVEKLKTITREVLPRGEEIHFELTGAGLKFYIRLHEPLIFEKKANKNAAMKPCKMEVYKSKVMDRYKLPKNFEFEPYEVKTLNQAFFKASVKYRPDNPSHSVNVYTHFRTSDGKELENLRF